MTDRGSAPAFVLASGSPRRAELLGRLGIPFDIESADVDETRLSGEEPADYVARVAGLKARSVADRRPGEIIVAADTTVVLDGDALGKPGESSMALAMLQRLLGRSHEVMTAVCVIGGFGSETTLVDAASVDLAVAEPEVVAWYVGTGEPLDKAGAYALQGVGAFLVEAVSGDPTTVIGLPFGPTLALLRQAGLAWPVLGQ